MSHSRRIALALLMLGGPACRSEAPTGASPDLIGVWQLTSVGGHPLPAVIHVVQTDTTFAIRGTMEFTTDSLWIRTMVVYSSFSPDFLGSESRGRFIERGVSVAFLTETGAHIATYAWKNGDQLVLKPGDPPLYRYVRLAAAP